jgi:hypothetical protein
MNRSLFTSNSDSGADYTTVKCVPDHLTIFRHYAVAISERSDAFVERRYSAYNRAMHRATRPLGDAVTEGLLVTGIFSRDLRSCGEKILVKKKSPGILSTKGLDLASSCGRMYMFPDTLKSVVLPQALERVKSVYDRIYTKGEALESVRDEAYAEMSCRKVRSESAFENAFEEARRAAGTDFPDKESVDPQGFDLSGYAAGLKTAVSSFFEGVEEHVINNPQLCSAVTSVVLVYIWATHLKKISLPKKILLWVLSELVSRCLLAWVSRLFRQSLSRRAVRKMGALIDCHDSAKLEKHLAGHCTPECLDAIVYWQAGQWKDDFKGVLNFEASEACGDAAEDGCEEGGFEDEFLEPQFGGVQAAFVTASMFFLTKKIPLYRAVVDNDKLQRNLTAMFCGSVGALEATLNTILRAFGRKQVVLLKAHLKVVGDWEHATRSFVDKIRLGALSPMSATSQMEYDRYRDQGLAFENAYKDPQSKAVIKRGVDALQSISCHFAIRGECTSRMEPVVLCFAGGAGVGKTTLARMISAQLAKHMCSEDEVHAVGGDLSKLCFQKGTSEYWEGYCGQPICVMDDWLQAIPIAGVENEVVNLIRAANQWPYPLNMASLEMKGKVNFTSRAILMTTNTTNTFYVSKVVTCPAAVARRMDMCYSVFVKPEFLKGPYLDVGKVSAIKPTSVADYDCVWEFRALDLEQGQNGNEVLSISELVKLMKANYDNRVIGETNTREFVRNFADLPVDPQIFGLGTVAKIGGAVLGACVVKSFVSTLSSVKKTASAGRHLVARALRNKTTIKVGLWFLTAEAVRRLVMGVSTFAKCVIVILKSLGSFFGFKSRNKLTPQLGGGDAVLERVRKNMVPIYGVYRKGGAKVPLGFGLFLTRQHLVLPFHFMREVRSKVVSLYINDGVNEIDLGICPVVREASLTAGGIRDFCILDVRRTFIGKRDIRCHFVSKNIQKNTAPGYFVKPDGVSQVVVGSVQDVRSYANILSERVALIQHSGYTQKGDCGSVLLLRNTAELRRIRGIHVAGLDTGFYCPLYAEDMPDWAEEQAFCGFEEVETVSPLHNNGVSGISPTGYSGYMVPPKGGPACLRPTPNKLGVVVDPMLSVVERSARDFGSIVLPKNTDMCISAVVGEIFDDIGDEDLSFLPYELAVSGLEGDGFIKGIARGKSMGYPLCRKYANKRPAFGFEGPYTFDSEAAAEVKREYDKLVDDYLHDRRSAIFRDCLKDEVLKEEKVANVDTRLISASPVHFTILVKQLYGRFAAQFMRKRLKHGGLVGVNVYSPEWSVVSHDLRSMNKDSLAAAGDYKAFDKSQHPDILRGILMAIARRLPHFEEMTKLFKGVALDTSEALHLGGDCYKSWVVYKIIGSLPSGHPLTSIINSIYNLVVFRMCWCDMYGDLAVSTFRDKVRCYVYGDDNIFAPSDSCLEFNLEAMARFCPRIGMVYTSEDKTGDLYKLKPVGSCSFLKRKFALDPDGYVYAPLEYHSIGDMLNWRKKKMTDEEHLEQVSVAVVRELAAYDFGTFDAGLGKLRSLTRQVGVRDPTRGIDGEYAYHVARGWYRGYTPVWSIDE